MRPRAVDALVGRREAATAPGRAPAVRPGITRALAGGRRRTGVRAPPRARHRVRRGATPCPAEDELIRSRSAPGRSGAASRTHPHGGGRGRRRRPRRPCGESRPPRRRGCRAPADRPSAARCGASSQRLRPSRTPRRRRRHARRVADRRHGAVSADVPLVPAPVTWRPTFADGPCRRPAGNRRCDTRVALDRGSGSA